MVGLSHSLAARTSFFSECRPETRDQRADCARVEPRGPGPGDHPGRRTALRRGLGPGFARCAAACHERRGAFRRAHPRRRRRAADLQIRGGARGPRRGEPPGVGILSGKLPLAPMPELRSHPLSSTTDALDDVIGPFSRVRNVASACSSGVSALALAMAWLLEDDLDAVVAGGTDGLCRLTLS